MFRILHVPNICQTASSDTPLFWLPLWHRKGTLKILSVDYNNHTVECAYAMRWGALYGGDLAVRTSDLRNTSVVLFTGPLKNQPNEQMQRVFGKRSFGNPWSTYLNRNQLFLQFQIRLSQNMHLSKGAGTLFCA